MNQEQLIQLQVIEQEANQLEQQLQLIEQNLAEMQELSSGLNELENSGEKDVLANIGKGIYIPAEIKSKELIVEVGNKNFVKKTIPETKKIIEEQIEKLNSAKQQIVDKVDELQGQMNGLIEPSNRKILND